MASVIFDSYVEDSISGGIDLTNNNIMCALMDDQYFPLSTDVTFDNTNEIVGTGYTSGGKPITGKLTISGYFKSAPVSWSGCVIATRWAVLYNASNSNRLVAAYDFGLVRRSRGGTFTVNWGSSGLLRHKRLTDA